MSNDIDVSPPFRMDVAGASKMSLADVRALVAKKKGGRKKRMIEAAGGEPAHDRAAFQEHVELMKLEAATRPPRTNRPPSNEYQTMTMSQGVKVVEGVLHGDLMPAPEVNPDPPRNFEESESRLRAAGLDEVLSLVSEGNSERELCARLGTRPSHLNRWIASIPEGGTRMREARQRGAQAWLDRGLAVLESSQTLTELAKAREIASMCRKYAAIQDPSFSDRVQVDATVKAEDASSIDAKLRLLVAEVGQNRVKHDDE